MRWGHCDPVQNRECRFALSVTLTGASIFRCDCPRQSLSFKIASLPPEGEPWDGAYTATRYKIESAASPSQSGSYLASQNIKV